MSPMGEENVTPEWKSYDGKRLQGLISSEPNKWSSKEPVKMAPPSSEWRGPRSRQFDFQGNRLDKINWNGMEIVPVQKTFLVEHPNVKERTLEQCEKIRLENSIQILDDGGQEIPKPVEIFEETPFPDWATDVLRNKRYDKPTPIQVQAWPVILGGHDCVGIAETGSGKTMAYVVPMLVHIIAQPNLTPGEGPVGLILVPHRELCNQVEKEIQLFSKHVGFNVASIYGGDDEMKQKAALAERCDIVIATPGRLIGMLNDKVTNLRRATFLVLDEADEMLRTSGFESQVRLILGQVRPDRQVCLFSATWPDSVGALAQDVCHDRPIKINVGSTKLSACRTIHQNFWLVGCCQHVMYPGESKDQVLLHAVEKLSDKPDKALIFCNSKDSVFRVVSNLCQNGYNAEGFCGGYTQEQREATIAKFSDLDSDLRLLVCTMVLGRGHDFKNLKYVVNYDLPCTTSGSRTGMVEYVHRIGRTGRAGERGYSLTLLEEPDLFQARELIDLLKESLQEVPHWLTEADTKRKRQKYWRMKWDPSHAAGHPSPDALVGVEESWSGRGTGRRHEFLKECGGLGAARTVAPGTS